MPPPCPTYQVALPLPLRRTFDYLSHAPVAIGARVVVPVGRRKMVGVVVSNQPSEYRGTLKPLQQVLDATPIFSPGLQQLLQWVGRYYHHPIGEVMQCALPAVLRRAQAEFDPEHRRGYRACGNTPPSTILAALQRAPKQRQVFEFICQHAWVDAPQLDQAVAPWRAALRALLDKGWVEMHIRSAPAVQSPSLAGRAPVLLAAQHAAVQQILATPRAFTPLLLQGITGSGKTEVYLEAARQVIMRQQQVLILVPEIALTSQLIARVKTRLGLSLGVIHSALSDRARYQNWWLARHGKVGAVLGTRSAVFAPLDNLGLIVVDEEHDASYKQQDGLRYNARDVAMKRASLAQIPVVLGSATPLMESIYNVNLQRCRRVELKKRYGGAELPHIDVIDLKTHTPTDGLSRPLLAAIGQRLARREQTILFLNRRGYAPVVHCVQCGWQAGCRRCDARLTYHQATQRFRCHHCAAEQAAVADCPDCGGKLAKTGVGTQRVTQRLVQHFPQARILRLDRDALATQRRLDAALAAINAAQVDIIVGTQLIAKGHDFAKVTLVGVINADQGLFGLDFRASEQMFQQLLQVSGRAGRAQQPGQVLLQTCYPHSEVLQLVCKQNYAQFATHCLQERQQFGFPPYRFLALWRAESTERTAPPTFLQQIRQLGEALCQQCNIPQVQIMDVVASPMEKQAGRYRYQLLVRATQRSRLHQVLSRWIEQVEQIKKAASVRWSIDVDPMDMY